MALDQLLGQVGTKDGTTRQLTTTASAASNTYIAFFFGFYNNYGNQVFSVANDGTDLGWTVYSPIGEGFLSGGIAIAAAPNGLASGTVITLSRTGGFTDQDQDGALIAASFTAVGGTLVDSEMGRWQEGITNWSTPALTCAVDDLVLGVAKQATSSQTHTATGGFIEIAQQDGEDANKTLAAIYKIAAATSETPQGTWGAIVNSASGGIVLQGGGAGKTVSQMGGIAKPTMLVPTAP